MIEKPSEGERIAVMCIGNMLMLDEGLGPRVAEELIKRYEFPEGVDVLDSGTMGMSLLADFKHYDFILVVDAVDNTGEEPGTVVRFSPEDIASYTVMHSAHDIRFIDVLEASELLGYRPVGRCIGVQVENMNPVELTMGLTPAVEAAVPLVIQTVLATLADRDVKGIVCKATGLVVDASGA